MIQPESDLVNKIKVASEQNAEFVNLLNKIHKNEINLNGTEYKVDQKSLIWFKDRLYMPNIIEIKLFILNEMHKPPFAVHPGY